MRFALLLTILASTAAAAGDLPQRPDPSLTPGAILTTDAATICVPGYAKSVRHVSGADKHRVYEEYGIDRTSGHFEIDHLISLSLGGSNDIRNLWPEGFDTMPWNARLKDRLEDRLHMLVCAGELDLSVAQQAISTDWVAAYQRYVGSP